MNVDQADFPGFVKRLLIEIALHHGPAGLIHPSRLEALAGRVIAEEYGSVPSVQGAVRMTARMCDIVKEEIQKQRNLNRGTG